MRNDSLRFMSPLSNVHLRIAPSLIASDRRLVFPLSSSTSNLVEAFRVGGQPFSREKGELSYAEVARLVSVAVD